VASRRIKRSQKGPSGKEFSERGNLFQRRGQYLIGDPNHQDHHGALVETSSVAGVGAKNDSARHTSHQIGIGRIPSPGNRDEIKQPARLDWRFFFIECSMGTNKVNGQAGRVFSGANFERRN